MDFHMCLKVLHFSVLTPHYCNLWLINVQSSKNLHKSTSTFTLIKVNVIFQFGSPKKTTQKVHMTIVPCKTFKKYAFGTKNLKNK